MASNRRLRIEAPSEFALFDNGFLVIPSNHRKLKLIQDSLPCRSQSKTHLKLPMISHNFHHFQISDCLSIFSLFSHRNPVEH